MKKYTVFDSHCDTATALWTRKETLSKTECHVSLPRAEHLKGYGQFFAFCTDAGRHPVWSGEQMLFEPYAYFLEQLRCHEDQIRLCTKGDDFDTAWMEGKVAAFLSLEGAEGISCDPGRVAQLREMGLSMVSLTWNGDNALAGCSAYHGGGLTAQGREFVRNAQRLGMIIDVSHVSDKAFWDIMDITEKPIVASHSNSRTLCGHSRNLTDEMFRAICETGGFAGINLYTAFLSDDCHANFETVYRHMDHFLQLGGENHVTLGGDLDGCDLLPDGFYGVHDYNALGDYLERHYDETTIQKIFSDTMKKVVTICTM